MKFQRKIEEVMGGYNLEIGIDFQIRELIK
jgi:hypothetical protein